LQLEISQIGVTSRERAQMQLQQRFLGLGRIDFASEFSPEVKKKAADFVIFETRRTSVMRVS
jgi:hypothetical protein